jgi:mannosyltransferase OCH1-like enzyme
MERSDCLIYSVGSDGTYAWEDDLVELLGSNNHCEIHVFHAPGSSEHYARAGDPETKNIHFHPWELQTGVSSGSLGVMSFQDALHKLGHQNRMIDVLRIDCDDKCEWSTYENWFTADIRQVLVATPGSKEWHQSPRHVADFFDGFADNHFAMHSKEVKMAGDSHSIEFGYIKLHDDFWGTRTKERRPEILDMTSLPKVSLPDPPPSPYKIPRRLIIVHETDIMAVQDPVESFFNVKHTEKIYKKSWGVQPVTWSLNEFTCLAAVYGLNAELALYFRAEKSMARKMDMCRVAALYLAGGYSHDVQMYVKKPFQPGDGTGLAIAIGERGISEQFLACEPKSAVMKVTLDKMCDFYRQHQVVPDFNLLTQALMAASDKIDPSVSSEVLTLSDLGGEITPWIQLEPPVHTFDNPVPLEMRKPPSPDFSIPRRLLFTYKSNILETKEPPAFYDNVQNTITKYREAWGEPDAPVWFLDDNDCRAAIYDAKPNLLKYFDWETDGSWKADICRVAALYLTGGYYFDIDMEVVNTWIPNPNVAFATVEEPDQTSFFQSFLASEKEGRLMGEALDQMLIFYERRMTRKDMLLGPDTLKWAYASVPIRERGETAILQEERAILDVKTDALLRVEGIGFGCDYVVMDPATNQRIFYSRIVGAGEGCQPRGSPEAYAYLLAHPPKEEKPK